MTDDNWTLDGLRVTDDAMRNRLREMIDDESDLIVEHRMYRRSSAPRRFVCSDPLELDRYLSTSVHAGDSLYFWRFDDCCRDDNVAETGKVPREDGATPVGGSY